MTERNTERERQLGKRGIDRDGRRGRERREGRLEIEIFRERGRERERERGRVN